MADCSTAPPPWPAALVGAACRCELLDAGPGRRAAWRPHYDAPEPAGTGRFVRPAACRRRRLAALLLTDVSLAAAALRWRYGSQRAAVAAAEPLRAVRERRAERKPALFLDVGAPVAAPAPLPGPRAWSSRRRSARCLLRRRRRPRIPPAPVEERAADAVAAKDEKPERAPVVLKQVKTAKARPAAAGTDYVFPPLESLDEPKTRVKKIAADTEANIAILENTLAQFRIEGEAVEIADGPTVTRYEIPSRRRDEPDCRRAPRVERGLGELLGERLGVGAGLPRLGVGGSRMFSDVGQRQVARQRPAERRVPEDRAAGQGAGSATWRWTWLSGGTSIRTSPQTSAVHDRRRSAARPFSSR